jgi:hypothetical protein
MILNLKKTKESLTPCDEDSVKVFNKLKIGDDIYVEFKPRRNYANHKRFFSMLQGVVHNSEHYKTVDNLLSIIKLKTGHFEIVISHKGEQLYIPKSIDFSKLPEDEFQSFFSDAIDVLLEFVSDEDIESILRYC